MSATVAESPAATISTEAEALAAADEFAVSLQRDVIERTAAGSCPSGSSRGFDAIGLLAITVPEIDGGPELPGHDARRGDPPDRGRRPGDRPGAAGATS